VSSFADLKSGSGSAELDKSECMLVFCTSHYFEKRISLKELYRAVCQQKYILAMLEPDVTQQGGLDQDEIEELISDARLEKLRVRCSFSRVGWRLTRLTLSFALDSLSVGSRLTGAQSLRRLENGRCTAAGCIGSSAR
jgi:hypothetical protein